MRILRKRRRPEDGAEQTLEPMTAEEEDQVFHAWECVSLLRRNGTTFDLVVKDMGQLMALIHFVHRQVYQTGNSRELRLYKMLKFKMKLGFETWNRRL